MADGPRFGDRGRARAFLGIDAFVDETGGYTSVSVAVALLVSLALTCSLVSVGWVQRRSADVQTVADACALAGANVVSSYATVATVLDACVLTMGLAGMVTLGAGLVVSAIPGLGAAGAKTVDAARQVFDSRGRFARSAARGLKKVEGTLPLAIVSRSAAVAQESGSWTGVAMPFPVESQSDFSALDVEVDPTEAAEAARRLQEASDRAKEARDRADEAMREAWLADCGADGMCLRERADALAGLAPVSNPSYALPLWTFGAPLTRARAYYAARLASEAPLGQGTDELTNSAARKAFYEYALEQVGRGHYEQLPDGGVDLDLPQLFSNVEQLRATTLYSASRWPCTQEGGRTVLHASMECPGARGASAGTASLVALDAGSVARCDTCRMDAQAMGSAPAASTSIDNGFEHYWRIVSEASERYERARNDLAEAEAQMRELAGEGKSAYERAMEALAVPRPRLCPPGAWGCVAVVTGGEREVPAEVTGAFLADSAVPAGAAVAAATLAPDSAAEGNDVLSRFFGVISEGMDGADAGVLGNIGSLWGELLVGYESAAGNVEAAATKILDGIDGVLGTSVSSWLRDMAKEAIRDAGLAPADLRPRKPVLTNSQYVLDKAGYDHVSSVRDFVSKLPDTADPVEFARALGREVKNELGTRIGKVTIAELTIPGTEITIPITIDVGELLGAA